MPATPAPRRQVELADKPKSARFQTTRARRDEGLRLFRRQAIQEEVRHHGVVVLRRRPAAGVRLDEADARAIAIRHAAPRQREHPRARIHHLHRRALIPLEQCGKEAAIAFPEDQNPFGRRKGTEVVETAGLERPAKGEILERTIRIGQRIGIHRSSSGGTSSAASTKARFFSGCHWAPRV